ncbi:MAG TPA: hypothetical protein VMF51_13660 [Nocardioides sp.]|uniref:hypothetical protein n=1 Tax=Nocardioides sp. TaxID=35761 RepID=UPI002BAD86EE|nr:hypothetical protein [Nocardioides sp.]HTW16176.1 hypothetical protein [Nocardioides sp.]
MTAIEPRWTSDERAALLASIGGGAHVRPLTPAAVGSLLTREAARGVRHDAMAEALHLDSAAMIGRFIRVAGLPPEIGASVGWGRSAKWINLTQAQEIARLEAPSEQRELTRLTLEYRLSGTEVRGAVQICLRRGVGVAAGVEETVRLRPVIERRYVQIGSLSRSEVQVAVAAMSEADRAALLSGALASVGLTVLDATLTERGYVLVLDEETGARADADRLEGEINRALAETIEAA